MNDGQPILAGAPSLAGPLDYDEAKRVARDGDLPARRMLASRIDTPPELLYYLAEDHDPAIRLVVSRNSATPLKAVRLLAEDPDPEVRGETASRLCQALGLYAGRSGSGTVRARKLLGEAIDVLARDQMVRVRSVLSEVLKEHVAAPPEVIGRLARDAEATVAIPVLEHSPLLSDADLIEVIESNPLEEVLSAISRRSTLDSEVTDAIVRTNSTGAITHLLRNGRAQIREATLDHLIDRAAAVDQWHEPLVYRPELNRDLVVKVARFVASHLLQQLMARTDLDPGTAERVAEVVRQRLERAPADPFAARPGRDDIYRPLIERARAMQAKRELSRVNLLAALYSDEVDFVTAALTVLSGLELGPVLSILASHSAKAIMALAWKAGLDASLAHELQLKLGHLRPTEALAPTAGKEYPLTNEAMDWQLELFQGT